MQNELKTNHIKYLKQMQQTVIDKLKLLGDLNSEYREKQEKNFMKVFLFVMDRMSTQLGQAQEMYQNIDSQIERDAKCLQLSTKLKFFKEQSLYLKEELDKTDAEIKRQKDKQKKILQQKQQIQSSLFHKSKQVYRYKTKARSLSLKQGKQILKTQKTQQESKFFSKISEKQRIYKNGSFSQTKNTKISSFTNIIKPNESLINNHTQTQFGIKAARLAKQRKLMISKSYYTNSKTKKNKNKQQILQILH